MGSYDDSSVLYCSQVVDVDGNLVGIHSQIDNTEQSENEKIKTSFKRFLLNFNESGLLAFKYRDKLNQNYKNGSLEIDWCDLVGYDETLAHGIVDRPLLYLKLLEEVATEVADEITSPRPTNEDRQYIQILLTSNRRILDIRKLNSEHIAKLDRICGLVISCSANKTKTETITIECRFCGHLIENMPFTPGQTLPSKCTGVKACGNNPFFLVPGKSVCINFQTLKLQELVESIPAGDIPRHLDIHCTRTLCGLAVPGNRLIIHGVYCVGVNASKKSTKIPTYFLAVGIKIDSTVGFVSRSEVITQSEIATFKRLASMPNVYETLAKSIAPQIYGFEDLKKAILCLLFSGSKKKLPDGSLRRSDIHMLMIGDPGIAKSQLLKFVAKVSPIGVYTSGKGCSAVGLTASVLRDPITKNFVVVGGAMVLGNGGVVCIDEFDKMDEDDRVAIHEAMEQGTISIAKGGIITTLNSRCSVLAAGNSVFGRWIDAKGAANLELMPTILSRFDYFCIIKDQHDQLTDIRLANHVIGVHTTAKPKSYTEKSSYYKNILRRDDGKPAVDVVDTVDTVDVDVLKRYIDFCRKECAPRLTKEVLAKLCSIYVSMRSSEQLGPFCIGIRQLEAIIRTSEALAKMELKSFANEDHVNEAIRLFRITTLAAMKCLKSVETTGLDETDTTITDLIESQLKARLPIGSKVTLANIIIQFKIHGYREEVITQVVASLLRRGILIHEQQRKFLCRVA